MSTVKLSPEFDCFGLFPYSDRGVQCNNCVQSFAQHIKIFEDAQEELFQKQPVMAASSLTEVRWAPKFEGVDKMIKRFRVILVSLQKIGSSNSKQADSAVHKILSGRFIISLCFLYYILH